MKSPLIVLLTDKIQLLRVQLETSRVEARRVGIDQTNAGPQNPEALHTLRVSLRQLHSLLLPLGHHLKGAADLDHEVKKRLKLTNPLRDQEVLIQELIHQNQPALAQVYTTRLQEEVGWVYPQLKLDTICERLATLPEHWARKLSPREAKQLSRLIRTEWVGTRHTLKQSIRQATPDKHRLRLLIKQLRYNSETYTAILPKKVRSETARLKQAQEVLGTWHDVEVWLETIHRHPELAVLESNWQQSLAHWDQAADQALLTLKAAWAS